LEETQLEIEAVSGTSAGAMNAAVLASGYEKEGKEGARKALKAFWKAISRKGAFSPYHSGPFNPYGADWSPVALGFDMMSHLLSPYQINPLNHNPLKDMIEETIDFEMLRRSRKIQLFISATNVNTNHLHVFTNKQLSAEVLLASACLPHLYQAVQIDGDYFWDGGFMGNPVLEPLVRLCETPDTIVVQVNPTQREELPRFALDIADRLNEITFNSNLMREIRSYLDVMKMIEKGYITDPHVERTYFHIIPIAKELARMGVRSKLDTSWTLLQRLFAVGRQQAEQWLAKHYNDIGRRSTLDLDQWTPTEMP
jgi:NTE family protein